MRIRRVTLILALTAALIGMAGLVVRSVPAAPEGDLDRPLPGQPGGASKLITGIAAPRAPLYVGSYVRVPFSRRLAVRLHEVEFRVAEGPQGGVVSPSRDATFDPARPHVMLIAGPRPGTYTLQAVQKSSGAVLASARFTVTARNPGGVLGPSLVVQGASGSTPAARAAGPGVAAMQNYNLHPAVGTRRIALLFVDTADQRFDPANLGALRKLWQDELMDGTICSDGVRRSLRQFYQESSGGRMDVSLQMFGPYHLDGNWRQVGPGPVGDLAAHAQAAITAADPDIDYRQFDTVLLASQSVGVPKAAGEQYAWPIASPGAWQWVTAEGIVSLGVIQMPVDWTTRLGNYVSIYATASHELGHNLGMLDQYHPKVQGRNVGGWDLMDNHLALPDFSLGHRLRLGWVEPGWVKTFDPRSQRRVNADLTLTPAFLGAPGPGRCVGAEVRLSEGLNVYFEYRRSDASRIADTGLPNNERILGTEVRSPGYEPSTADGPELLRPDLLLLPPGEGRWDSSILASGQAFVRNDGVVDLIAAAHDFAGGQAGLSVECRVNDFADPSIRPWGAPPYQSPDIEVRNARSAADPAWRNVPWAGNPNEIVARVKNEGPRDATRVGVQFTIQDFNVGGGTMTSLGYDRHDIPAGAAVEFRQRWTPPAEGHYCVNVRIEPSRRELDDFCKENNYAQSNYDRFISAHASPAERRITEVGLVNPYDRPTRVYLKVEHPHPLYRTYLEHRWVDLGANEARRVGVMVEYAGDPPPVGTPQEANRVRLAAYIVDPSDPHGHVMHRLGGAEIEVVTGQATRFERFGWANGVASGEVVTSAGQPVAAGVVILTVTSSTGSPRNVTGALANGQFRIPTGTGESVGAYYVPAAGYGDATSSTVPMREAPASSPTPSSSPTLSPPTGPGSNPVVPR